MLGRGGIYRGSSVLISGVAGSGKTILGASFVAAACARGERCIFFSTSESADQLIRNVGSAGISLRPYLQTGLLRFETKRPTSVGFEMHLAHMQRLSLIHISPGSRKMNHIFIATKGTGNAQRHH